MSDIIFKRRSIRKYKKKEVETEKIKKLLSAAMAAPTAGNQREWEFIVVTDQDLIQKLSGVSRYAGCLAGVPLAIVPIAKLEGCRFVDYWPQDLGASVQNILLEAVELELGAVWLGIAPLKDRMDKVAEILEIPEGYIPFAIVSVGYPAEEKTGGDRYQEEKVHWGRFGGTHNDM